MCGYGINSVSISKGGQHMKLLKLLSVFILILSLTACLALPVEKWQLNDEKNEAEQNQEIHEKEVIEDNTEEQQVQDNDIEKNQILRQAMKKSRWRKKIQIR